MTIQQIRYAITITETGSLNKAAEQLYVSQPSLTSAMKELESELGITIFNRTGKGVTLTSDGVEFITYARQLYGQFDDMLEHFGKAGNLKKKFGVSAQHYSFAVKAFVEMVKSYDTLKYEFAMRECMTREVINDVVQMRSEIGILFLSDFNRRAMLKLFKTSNLEFKPLIVCKAYVYLWRGHPLAGEKEITLDQLSGYPCLSFEQGENASFYLSEEVFSSNEFSRTIKTSDRATTLNLMVGLNGYILCSGIICEELNGDEYVAVPFKSEEEGRSGDMEIGYIRRRDMIPSKMGELYIKKIKEYLGIAG
ncbi:MAG: LysR family transcriptional regulator [Clostridia bacterium]|nr:LysR family transcriptional regulator [Clostridia bacterium]